VLSGQVTGRPGGDCSVRAASLAGSAPAPRRAALAADTGFGDLQCSQDVNVSCGRFTESPLKREGRSVFQQIAGVGVGVELRLLCSWEFQLGQSCSHLMT